MSRSCTSRVHIAPRAQNPKRLLNGGAETERAGYFFSEIVSLRRGAYVARVQLVFSEKCHGERITISARRVAGSTVLRSVELVADPARLDAADEIYLAFETGENADDADSPIEIELLGFAEDNRATTMVRYITIIGVDDHAWSREDFFFDEPRHPDIAKLQYVFLGTTGRCNASCVHCPTNKPVRGGSNGVMKPEVFDRLIGDLAAGGFKGNVMFGLFGEPLGDPDIVQRLRTIRARMPDAKISVSTNGGLFEPAEHTELLTLADMIGLHVESADAEVFNEVMRPLKAEKVFPKIDRMLELNERIDGCAMAVVSPLHARNVDGIDQLRRRFASGRGRLHFSSFGNRCWDDGPFRELSLAPIGGMCGPDILRDWIVVDFDGAVLPCCSDFSRSVPLGNIARQSLAEVFESDAWKGFSQRLRQKEWCSVESCARCRMDDPCFVEKLTHEILIADHPKLHRMPASAFFIRAGAGRRSSDALTVEAESSDGVVVFGPYAQIPEGRYKVSYDLERQSHPGTTAHLTLDVCVNGATEILASKTFFPEAEDDFSIEFTQDAGRDVEFRISKTGPLALKFVGVELLRLDCP